MRKLIGVVGAGAALLSAPLTILSVSSFLTNPGHTPLPVLAAMTVFFAGITAAGAWLGVRNLRRARPSEMSEFDREQVILRLATKSDGRVTVAEVAARCRMTVADAKTALEKMCTHGVAEVLFTDEGSIVYEFKGLLTEEERRTATDPLLSELQRSRAAAKDLEG